MVSTGVALSLTDPALKSIDESIGFGAGELKKIRILGIGDSGQDTLDRLIRSRYSGIDSIAANTDFSCLLHSLARVRIPLGEMSNWGTGTFANPEKGRKAALKQKARFIREIGNSKVLLIVAGMGGGTGTGGAPVIAQIGKELGAVVIAVVTTPFLFEYERRQVNAKMGIVALRNVADRLIIIPNQAYLSFAAKWPSPEIVHALRDADKAVLNKALGILETVSY